MVMILGIGENVEADHRMFRAFGYGLGPVSFFMPV